MGKVIVMINTTLDGFVDGQHVIVDPGLFEFTIQLMKDVEIAAFGRTTFEMFQERWPQRLIDKDTPGWVRDMAQALHDVPKVVFSSTLKTTTWNNSIINNELNVDYVKEFKQNSNGTLLTFGSISLIEALTVMNIVDDYYFNIQPLIAGKGEVRLFNKMNLDLPLSLKYVDHTQLSSGAQIIHYINGSVD